MAAGRPKTFLAGAALVWRRQGVLWLLYIAVLFLAFVGTRGAVARSATILNHSLAADRLVHTFNLGAYYELILHPAAPFGGSRPMLVYSSILFALFALFTTGGALAAYLLDRRVAAAEFFGACGEQLGRFLRLLACFVIALVPIGIMGTLSGILFHRIEERSNSPFASFHFLEGAAAIILLLLMCVRLWFDLAQVIIVAENEPKVRRALRRSASLLRQNFGSLFWLYARISLVGWVGSYVGVRIWLTHLQPESIGASFFVTQAIILFSLATRLWQRASEVLWYQQRLFSLTVPEPVAPLAPVAPAELEPVST